MITWNEKGHCAETDTNNGQEIKELLDDSKWILLITALKWNKIIQKIECNMSFNKITQNQGWQRR